METEDFFNLPKPVQQKVLSALDSVFRKLLANLLLHFDDPKFRTVKQENKALVRHTEFLSDDIVQKLFETIGFHKKEGLWVFDGTMETLRKADCVFTEIENKSREKEGSFVPHDIGNVVKNRELERERILALIKADRKPAEDEVRLVDNSKLFCEEDFRAADDLKETVKMSILNTGRLRNCFFDAEDFTTRRMLSGCVFECGKGCTKNCIEAHWHLVTKNTLYSYIAHLTEDGKQVKHLGTEFGYQYNSTPGTQNFRKTVCFSAKETGADGSLKRIEHPNKVVTNCVYCNKELLDILV